MYDPTSDVPGAVPAGCVLTLGQFNHVARDAAIDLVWSCLPVQRWTAAVVSARPYGQRQDLFDVARHAAQPFLSSEVEAAATYYDSQSSWPPPALLRLAGTAGSQGALARDILTDSQAYAERFGRPFLICRTGRSLRTVQVKLQIRLLNTTAAETRAVSHELRQFAVHALTYRITA